MHQEYIAMLTQSGENSPVVTVQHSDFQDEVIWTRQEAGVYKGEGPFPVGRTVAFASMNPFTGDANNVGVDLGAGDAIFLITTGISGQQSVEANSTISLRVEVRPETLASITWDGETETMTEAIQDLIAAVNVMRQA